MIPLRSAAMDAKQVHLCMKPMSSIHLSLQAAFLEIALAEQQRSSTTAVDVSCAPGISRDKLNSGK